MPAGAAPDRRARCASAVRPVFASAVAVLVALAARHLVRLRQVREARAVLAEPRTTRRETAPAAPEARSFRTTHW